MINEAIMRKLFLSFAILAVFVFSILSSLAAVLAQESQPVGLGMAVSVQCYRNGVPYDCSQSNTTTLTTTTTTPTTTTTMPATTTTTTETTTTTTATETPSETSSSITSQAGQTSSFNLSDPTTAAGIVVIIVVVIAAFVLYRKGYLGGESNFRYQYKS
jgi:carbohydrate-binding DOMON domain-containing protein